MSSPATTPLGGAAALLAEARDRTFALVAPLSDEDLHRQLSPIMSPLVWDLAHIAAYEDLWAVHRTGGMDLLRPDVADTYDAFETPRSKRGKIELLRDREAREYMAQVREQALEVLGREGDGYVWGLLLEHEQQHNETMLQALKLAERGVYVPRRRPLPPAPEQAPSGTVLVPAGPFEMGDDGDGFAYDNERPRHVVEVAAFEIDRAPVTNGDWLAFMEDGGYRRRELWSEDGWEWRSSEAVERPLFWSADGTVQEFERVGPPDPAHPVAHVSWFEADAYARWRGMRLPTEAEWEKAATWDPEAGVKRRHPWGDEQPDPARHANVDQTAFGTAPAGAYPGGASAYGVLGMIGDGWEWTATDFGGYPGFRAFPYREYSEVFFGEDYKVLRGGSWATRPRVARGTFRNWDHPYRRQIFAGLRCAREA